jgi:amylosucrase
MFEPNSYQRIVHFLSLIGSDIYGTATQHRLIANIDEICKLYADLYGHLPNNQVVFESLLQTIIDYHQKRPEVFKIEDHKKLVQPRAWFLDNKIVGMSLYVDRFAKNLLGVKNKMDYLKDLGVSFIHLMPIMESPENESDGGYAVSDFRKVDERFGNIEDLMELRCEMAKNDMYLMLDIVLNHTSYKHDWAVKASAGDPQYQSYYYMYDDRVVPDQFEKFMPEVFPESSPGNFTLDPKSGKWVMTVFNSYQWDLNFSNPHVLVSMLENIFYYANLGVDILRIDAPAFIWKEIGTNCQNLPQAHKLLQIIKLCVQITAPGMALLGEAIVAPKEILKYFGTGTYHGRECDIAYNATHMALQWDALATGNIRVMMGAQHDISLKPYGNTWINYTRCHDDIGLGYEDAVIAQAGFNPKEHRKFLKQYYSGVFPNSPAKGALFGVNESTDDARISGSLASLCGLETALASKNKEDVVTAVDKILLMQAFSIFLGGIPMLFYGDEQGYTNDYSYMNDPGKSYDNRWMHRPIIDWQKHDSKKVKNSVSQHIFTSTKKIINIRKTYDVFADTNNLRWLPIVNNHVTGFVRNSDEEQLYVLLNFGHHEAYISWYMIKAYGINIGASIIDIWTENSYIVGRDDEYLKMHPHQFMVIKVQ